MAKYINAAEAAEIVSQKTGIKLVDLVDVFAEIPSADVAPVVRCRDCKWYDRKVWCPVAMSGFHEVGMLLPHEDDFCSYGERKEENDER